MAKQSKVNPRSFQKKSRSKIERGKKANHGGFRERCADETPDGNYLEVVEEMLRRRENNGRDRDECTEALKNND